MKKGVLHTPASRRSILEGITRDTVLTLAREEGIPVGEGRITRDQLWLADEVFFTGTAAEVTPVREVDNRAIGDGTVGPITKRLQARFFDVVKGSDTRIPSGIRRSNGAARHARRGVLGAGRRRGRLLGGALSRPQRVIPRRSPRKRRGRPRSRTAAGARSTPSASKPRCACPMARAGASTTTTPLG